MIKRLITVLLSVLAVLGGGIATAPQAQARTACSVPTPEKWTHGCWPFGFIQERARLSVQGTRTTYKLWFVPPTRDPLNLRRYGIYQQQVVAGYGAGQRVTNHAIRFNTWIYGGNAGVFWKADSGSSSTAYTNTKFFWVDPKNHAIRLQAQASFQATTIPAYRTSAPGTSMIWYLGANAPVIHGGY